MEDVWETGGLGMELDLKSLRDFGLRSSWVFGAKMGSDG